MAENWGVTGRLVDDLKEWDTRIKETKDIVGKDLFDQIGTDIMHAYRTTGLRLLVRDMEAKVVLNGGDPSA